MGTAQEAFKALLHTWLEMCCTTPELIDNYNRLYRTKVDFTPKLRSPIEAMVDKACGHAPGVTIPDTEDNSQFVRHCIDLFMRMNGVPTAARAQPAEQGEG